MSPSRRVLAERIKGNERLRQQQERWERDRRVEDRVERAKKDEELNGVRYQLREQAGTFATKDMLNAQDRTWDAKLDSTVEKLNTLGTQDFRETNAERTGREDATKELLANTKSANETTSTNRRWIIGLVVTVLLAMVANVLTLIALLAHLAHLY